MMATTARPKPVNRIPHRSSVVVYDPPITLLELMLRLHRPGMGDARSRYEISLSEQITCSSNPEERAAEASDIRFQGRGQIFERGQGDAAYQRGFVGEITYDTDHHVTRLEPDHNAKFYNAERLLLLAGTPL